MPDDRLRWTATEEAEMAAIREARAAEMGHPLTEAEAARWSDGFIEGLLQGIGYDDYRDLAPLRRRPHREQE